MGEQNDDQGHKQNCADFVNDGQCDDAVDIHDHNAGDQCNAVKHSHDDFKGGELPFLFG